MPTFKTEAIVLAKRPLWEADRLYLLYTPHFGKITAQVKAAARSSSKLAGSLEPLSLVDLMVVKGRRRETIAGVQLKKRYAFGSLEIAIQADLVRELFLKIVRDGDKEERLYANLKSYLACLEAMVSPLSARFLTQRFVWQMLEIMGYGPERKTNGNPLFAACLTGRPTALQISDNLLQELETETRNYLRNVLESDLHSFHFNFAYA